MSENVRIGFVGTGGIAGHHMGNLGKLEGVQFAAMCDVVADRAEDRAKEHGCPAFTDYRRMLDEVEMDALYVCVPPFAHEDAEIRAAERGIHLFVEKPVVMEVDKGVAILAAIREAGVLSSVGYSLRYRPPVQAARQFLDGRDIALICADRWGGIPGDENHWWRVYDKSGGQLMEMTTHQVDSMRWLAGDVKEVYARYARRVTDDVPNMTVPDAQVATLEFTSGAVGYVSTSCALTRGGYGSALKVILRDMVVEIGGSDVKIVPEGADTPVELPSEGADIDASFVAAVRSGDGSSILCDYEDGLKSAAVSIAANESAASGRPVRCWN